MLLGEVASRMAAYLMLGAELAGIPVPESRIAD
jgi:hypothetical protein